MSQQDSGEKTEQPTDKRLRDARKKGDVAKSRELTTSLTLVGWLALSVLVLPLAGHRLMALTERTLAAVSQSFAGSAAALGWLALEALVWTSAMCFVPVTAMALLTEFLQSGPVLSFEKVKPKLENLDPVQRVKQWFSADQAMELFKSALKTVLMIVIAWLVLRRQLAAIALLPTGSPWQVLQAYLDVGLHLLAWTALAFLGISVLDVFWQRHRFLKKQRMSIKDIRDEHKESDGDPHVRAARRQLHRELAEAPMRKAAAHATALVVNPTHVAVALWYDAKACPVPMITAMGTDRMALQMRKAARDAGVPVVRNVALARVLLAEGQEGSTVPERHFEVVAEVILWARQVRDELDRARGRETAPPPERQRPPPGEDLTHYPPAQAAFQPAPRTDA